jgi:cytochrome c peroxidase
MMIGGNVYQKIGIFGNFFAAGTVLNQADLGRYAVTGKAEDKHVFRVPSLRNVAVTAPYFHNGAAKNLHQAVKAMAEHQLGVTLSELEINNIVAFLKTLTGTWQGVPLQSP